MNGAGTTSRSAGGRRDSSSDSGSGVTSSSDGKSVPRPPAADRRPRAALRSTVRACCFGTRTSPGPRRVAGGWATESSSSMTSEVRQRAVRGGRATPSLFMRKRSVLGLRASRSAALPGAVDPPAALVEHRLDVRALDGGQRPIARPSTSSCRRPHVEGLIESPARPRRADHRALDDVLEFAHVAGPVVALASASMARRGARADAPAHPPLVARDEAPDQHGDVFGPFAQRRQR